MAVAFLKCSGSKPDNTIPRRLSVFGRTIESDKQSSEEKDNLFKDNRDPYLSPTKKLFILIRTESAVMLPPRAYTATSGLSPISLANTATPYASRTPEANGSITFPAASNRVATRDNTILARPPPVYTNMSSARAQLNER